jgi:hypothetical protein
MTGSITSVIDAQLANGVAWSRSIIIGAILIGILLLGVTLVAGHVTLGYTDSLIASYGVNFQSVVHTVRMHASD